MKQHLCPSWLGTLVRILETPTHTLRFFDSDKQLRTSSGHTVRQGLLGPLGIVQVSPFLVHVGKLRPGS